MSSSRLRSGLAVRRTVRRIGDRCRWGVRSGIVALPSWPAKGWQRRPNAFYPRGLSRRPWAPSPAHDTLSTNGQPGPDTIGQAPHAPPQADPLPAGRAAGGDPVRVPAAADVCPGRRQFLRLQQRPDHSGLRVDQLHRRAGIGGHLAHLPEHAPLYRHRLGRHGCPRLHRRLCAGVRNPQPHHADGVVPGLHRAVPDVQHHPHDLVDSVSRPRRAC